MRKIAAAFLLLSGVLTANPGRGDAETRTISWSAVTTYTDNTPIEPEKTVTYDVFWTTDVALSPASLHAIATSIPQTSTTFDADAHGIPRGQPVYFTGDAKLNTGETSALSAPYTWNVPTLSGLSVSGPSSVNENGTGTYTATATWSDSSTTPVTPTWSVAPTTYASISASGVLTALTVTMDQTVTVTASYTSGGVTRTGTRSVTIVNAASAGALSVSPAGGLTSTGTVGGPFTPSSQSYTLSNTGGASINWTASKAQAWVTLSATSGTLAAGGTATVTASIGSGANSLAAGSYSDTVTFANTTNGTGNATRAVSLTVNASALVISTATPLPGGTVGTSYSQTFAATGGTSPYSWALSAGTLPAGLTLSAGGVLSGTPTSAGTSNFTVQVTGGGTATKAFSVTIVNAPPVPVAPMNMILSGPVQTSPVKLFRLGWDPVTMYMDGTPIGTTSVSYSAYWTTDETLSVGSLRALATSIPGTSVTFDPAAEGMAHNQRVYLTAKAILAAGGESALSGGLAWVAINEGPVAPSNPTIIKR